VRFGEKGLSAQPNDGMRAGTYRLVEGIVQIAFARGAEVMITAPAEFELQSDERVLLRRGKLSAKVPEQARGFTVETPTATLVDLGTEFAADVDRDGNGEVHVFRGEVIVKPRSLTDSRPVRLIGAQATRVDVASATPSGIEVDSTRFVRQFDEPKTSYSQLISKLGPDAYLRMEPTVDGNSLIDSGSPGGFGRLVLSPSYATPWSPGLLGSSLRLRGPSFGDYATMPFSPKRFGKTLSVVAWVYAESRPRWASIVKRWGMVGDRCFHFGLSGDDGDLEVHVAQPGGGEPAAREGRPLPTGRWHHVAFVADGTALRLYRNGVEVAKADCTGLEPGTLDVLGVGTKLNVPGTEPDPIEPGYWHGRLDEISIFCRALEPYQIHQLHQAAVRPEPDGQR
jgi:Concanavalin A-like lectin/glucanases superfamily/FecR protein